MSDSAVPATLADLQSLFSNQIQSAGQVAVTEANVGIAGLTNLLNATIGPNLVIAGAVVTLSDSSVVLAGTVTLFSTLFQVSLTFAHADSGFAFSFSAVQATGTSLSLNAVISQVMPSAKNTPIVRLNSLQISFNTADSSYLFSGAVNPWQVAIANQAATITPSVSITPSGAALTGTLVIGTATFAVTLTIGKGAQTLVGSWTTTGQPLGWNSLVSAAGLSSALTIPSNFTNAGFTSAQLTLDLGSNALTLAGQTSDGAAFFSAAKINSVWSVVVGVAVANNWTFSQLSSSLGPLDFLQLQQAYLLLSSSTQKQYTFPGFAPMSTPIDIAQGLNLGAVANFSSQGSGLSKAISSVLGSSTLAIQGSVGTLANTQLSASLGGSMVIAGAGGLTIGSPKLVILPSPLTAQVHGMLAVPLGKTQVIDFTGRLAISPEEADFTLDVSGGSNNQSLPAPFGFTGVTLQNIGISLGIRFTPPGVDLALEAIFAINGAQGATSSNKCALELEVEPDAVNPILLWGQFDSLSFPLVFSAFVPKIKLPSDFDKLSLQGVYVYYCEQPTVLPDNTTAAPGFALSGTLNAFKFTMAAALQINFTSGISGSAAMSPINLAHNAVSISGNSSLKGPQVAFSTVSSPYLNVTLDATVLDVAGAHVNATITSSGFSFLLALNAQSSAGADAFNAMLSCTFVDPQNFNASANLVFKLHLNVGPIKPPQTNVNLGTININTQFSGTVSFKVTSTAISGGVSGSFDGRALPTVSFNTPTAQLKSIPSMVEQQIRSNIQSIYSDVLGSASKWASMVSSGAITGVSDAGSVLTGFYNQSTDAAQALMKQFKLHGNLQVHADTAGSHQDAAAQHGDTQAVHTDSSVPHIDGAHVDTHTPHVDGSKIGIHVDTGGGHDDTHADTGGHIDITSIPHIDASVTPHIDTSTPHVDQNIHVDL